MQISQILASKTSKDLMSIAGEIVEALGETANKLPGEISAKDVSKEDLHRLRMMAMEVRNKSFLGDPGGITGAVLEDHAEA